MEEKQSGFLKNKLLKIKKIEDKVIFWTESCLSIIGIFASIFFSIKEPNNIVICVTVGICQVIVVIICCVAVVSIHKSEKKIDEAQFVIDQEKKNIEIKDVFINSLLDVNNESFKRLNHAIALIKEATNEASNQPIDFNRYLNSNDATEKKDGLAMLKSHEDNFKGKVRNIYEHYVCETFNDLSNTISSYFKTKYYDKICFYVSLEMFESETVIKRIESTKIYTGYALCKADDKTAVIPREVLKPQSYSENEDYKKCISKERKYNENRIVEKLGTSLFQRNERCLGYSNCIATVPVYLESREPTYFGFLCCYTENNSSVDMLDDEIIKIMNTIAINMGTFIDYLNTSYKKAINDDQDQDFLRFLNQKKYFNSERI